MTNKKSKWSPEVQELILALHSQLMLNDRDWHRFKADNERRAAELLASALSQIVNDGRKDDIEELIEQSLLWIKKEIKDIGCPSK